MTIRPQRHPHAHVLLAALAELSAQAFDGCGYDEFVAQVRRAVPDCTGITDCSFVSTLDPLPAAPHVRVALGGLHGDTALQVVLRHVRFADVDLHSFVNAAGSLAARVCGTVHLTCAEHQLDPVAVEAFIEQTRRFLAGED